MEQLRNRMIEREKFSVNRKENGIIELILKDSCTIELNDSIEMENVLSQKMNGDPGLLLIITEANTSVSKESKDYSVKNPLKAKAMAVITKSLPQKMVTNFIMVAYRKRLPNYPMKMFIKKEKAIEWLLKQ